MENERKCKSLEIGKDGTRYHHGDKFHFRTTFEDVVTRQSRTFDSFPCANHVETTRRLMTRNGQYLWGRVKMTMCEIVSESNRKEK